MTFDARSVHPFPPLHGASEQQFPAQATSLWGQLAAAKAVVSEPRGMGDDFDAVMAEFYDGVRSGRGALFLAVCRGKVGLDPVCALHRGVVSQLLMQSSRAHAAQLFAIRFTRMKIRAGNCSGFFRVKS